MVWGKIVKGNPNYSGTIFTATFALSRNLGWSYFERLAQQKVVRMQSARDPPNRLARGESAVQADGTQSELFCCGSGVRRWRLFTRARARH